MNWKRMGKKLLFLPGWVMAILSLFSAVALTTVFIKGWEQSAIAYIAYVIAFYTLTVVCVFFSVVLPKRYRQIKQKIYDHPLGNHYMTDRVFRTKLSLHLSLGISLLYVGINLWFWYTLHSWWFMVLAVYYVIMATMRFLLAGYVRKNEIGASILSEWKRARSCAYILLLVNLCLSGAVLMILYQSKGYEYPGVMIYVMALYTFYCAIHAVVDMVKYRKLGSPVMSAAKVVSLSAALVSVLNLETAMFAQFGTEMSVADRQIFIILTGAGVSITVVTLSVLLIARASKEIRREKYGK